VAPLGRQHLAPGLAPDHVVLGGPHPPTTRAEITAHPPPTHATYMLPKYPN
jgi:hypothetical protein